MQGPSYYDVKALLQSGPLQQADDRCPAHILAGHNYREQDRCPYWHLNRTPAAGTLSSGICPNLTIVYGPLLIIMFCLCWQLVLTRSSPLIFANYSLVENQRVSSIAAVYSAEYLLFVVGDKVQEHSHEMRVKYKGSGIWSEGTQGQLLYFYHVCLVVCVVCNVCRDGCLALYRNPSLPMGPNKSNLTQPNFTPTD